MIISERICETFFRTIGTFNLFKNGRLLPIVNISHKKLMSQHLLNSQGK